MSWPASWHWPGDDDSFPSTTQFVRDRLQSKMPPDLLSEPIIEDVTNSMADELYALWEGLRRIQDSLFPATAGSLDLEIWERVIDLPVNPVGVDINDRRNRIISKLISRFQFHGKDLRAGIELIAGPIVSTTFNNTTGTVTIELTGAASQYAVDQVEKYCIESGPAHLQWIILAPDASSAFVAGISKAGDQL